MSKKVGQYYDTWIDAGMVNPPSGIELLVTVEGFVDKVPIVQIGSYDKVTDKWTVLFGAWSNELYVSFWAFKPEPGISYMTNRNLKSGKYHYDEVMRKKYDLQVMIYVFVNFIVLGLSFVADAYNLGPFDAKDNWAGLLVLVLPALVVANLITYLIIEKFKDAYPQFA